MMRHTLSRRDFLKLAGLGAGTLAMRGFHRPAQLPMRLPQFPQGERLGRVAVTPNFYSTELKPKPSDQATAIRNVAQDEVVVWNREVIGSTMFGGTNRRWVETPEGYLYASHLQPVRNLPNTPINAVPEGKQGFWAEVTVPYVDLQLQAAPISPSIKYLLETSQPIRLYYGQVVWLDQVASDGSSVFYRFNEAPGHGYGYGDLFMADGAAFRPLTDADVSPIHP
ncbi:MAG TPA: twin-arginine translocation signal domain-containing protein, partial [Anaerolineales bacterium]